jgi:murein DD-endopeptidase MepM/ murein hydrolase activator NlpD
MSDLYAFLLFMRGYVFGHILHVGLAFDFLKDTIVRLLLFKRGKYSVSIVNSSFIVLTIILTVTVPIVAQNNPFRQDSLFSESILYSTNEKLISLDEDQISLDTIRSKIRDKVEMYTVQNGDTLQSLAKKFEVSEKTITWANSLKTTKLRPGSTLKIPPITGVIHQVEPGDTIYSIAKKYGVKAQNIVNFPFNEFKDESFNLIANSTLVIPDGVLYEQSSGPAPDTYAFAKVVEGVRGSSNFIWPTRGIITQYPTVYHMALDIADNGAPPILAADAGTVIYSGCFSWGYGCHIIIDHNNGYRTLYGHMSRRDVEQGDVVSQGQQIGVMGSTGRSTGMHLHFEVRQGNVLLNPQTFLQ